MEILRVGDRDEMYGFGYFIALAAAAAMALIFLKLKSKYKCLPPGPPRLPVIGNLHMVGSVPHRILETLARKYGPLMFLRLGCVPVAVASSAEMAREFLKIHDADFASRPTKSFGKNVMYDYLSVGFSTYGPHWKQVRKVVVNQLLGPRFIDSFKAMRSDEMASMVNGLLDHCRTKESTPVDFSELLDAVTHHMNWKMTFGMNYVDREVDTARFHELIEEFFDLAGALNVGDFLPFLERFDLQGRTRRQKNLHKALDDLFERVVEDHLESRSTRQAPPSPRDHADLLLDFMLSKDAENRLTRKEIKALMLDMIVGGIDVTGVTIQWAISEMLVNPSIMKKAQEELERVVGKDRKVVEEADMGRLEYLRAVVKETLRVHPAVPILVPRESTEDCTINGFHIPATSRIVVNAAAIGFDPHSWGDDARKFRPERFMGREIDLKGQHFEFIPFGSGRRMCPGMSLAMIVLHLFLANLLHCFEWKAVGELDLTEGFGPGLSAGMKSPLHAVPTPRIHQTNVSTNGSLH